MILPQIPKWNWEKSTPGNNDCRVLYRKSQANLQEARERAEFRRLSKKYGSL
jgi:hypothetical protein